MKLTILGCQGPFPGPGGATSGYLLEEKGHKLLLDCGSGVLGRLQQHASLSDLAGVFISHFHYDHYVDLLLLRYWREVVGIGEPLPVFTPKGSVPESLSDGGVFSLFPVEEGINYTFGPWELGFLRTKHSVPCCALTVKGESRFAYSADTGPEEKLVDFFRDADLLLCEAAWQGVGGLNHLTPGEAAGLAGRAGVKRLLLTHFKPGVDLGGILDEAQMVFPQAALAKEGEEHEF